MNTTVGTLATQANLATTNSNVTTLTSGLATANTNIGNLQTSVSTLNNGPGSGIFNTGTFSGLLTATGGFTGTTGTFSGALISNGLHSANGGLNTTNLTASSGNFSGLVLNNATPGTITAAGNNSLVFQGTGYTTTTGKTTNGVAGGTSVISGNKWTLGEITGPISNQNRLCLSLNNIPYACLAPGPNNSINLMAASDPSW